MGYLLDGGREGAVEFVCGVTVSLEGNVHFLDLSQF